MATNLTGNAIIFTQGGPTGVINASWVGVVQGLMNSDNVTGIWGALHGIDGILNEEFVDLREQTVRTLQNIARTPATSLGSTRKKPTAEDNAKMLDIMQKYNVRFVFGIGGNDTSETLDIINEAAIAEEYEVHMLHVCKTVDCDLLENDHTPGYGSAARFVSLAFRGVDLDNTAFGGIYLGVCMGRHAGFLTAASTLGRATDTSGPHLVYVPERAFNVEKFVDDVEEVYQKLGRCVIAVSEGIEDEQGNPILQVLASDALEADSHGNVQLSGTGALADALIARIKEHFNARGLGEKLRARGDTLGYLQRSYPYQSEVDREEALLVGRTAAEKALSGNVNGSVAIKRVSTVPYKVEYELVPLKAVAGKTRYLPEEFINDAGNNVTDAFIQWGKPLLGVMPPVGLPDMRHKIEKIGG